MTKALMLWLPFLSRVQDNPPVQPPRLFPFSIVYTPIPLVTWVLPFVGHVGVCSSSGLIYDFAGALFAATLSDVVISQALKRDLSIVCRPILCQQEWGPGVWQCHKVLHCVTTIGHLLSQQPA